MSSRDDFEQLVNASWDQLTRIAFRLTSDYYGAQDVVQDVLARTYARWDRIATLESPMGYLTKSVVNASMDWHRQHSRRREREHRVALRAGELAVDDPADRVAGESEFENLLARLPARQRAVLILRFQEDYSEADIAVVMGISPGSVKQHAARGLTTLRQSSIWKEGGPRGG